MYRLKAVWSKLPTGECGAYDLGPAPTLAEADQAAQRHLKALPGSGAVDHIRFFETMRAESAWYTRIGEDQYVVRIDKEA